MPPTTPRRQLNVRLPPDLIDQIEAEIEADGRAKQDVVAAALRMYFDDSSDIADDSSENGSGRADDSSMIAALTGQLREKDKQITELHVMLQTAITPPLQLPPAPWAEGGRRKWWQFWKR